MGIECEDNSFLGLVGWNLKSMVRETKVVGTVVDVCQVLLWVIACRFDGPSQLPAFDNTYILSYILFTIRKQ